MQMEVSKVGERALESVKNIEDSVFKKPAVPKKKVLDEETYSEKLEDIIVRDFFPDTPKLAAQSQYLDALQRNDLEKLRELHIKFGPKRGNTRTPTIFSTPLSFETPESSNLNEDQPNEDPDSGPTHNPEAKEKKDKDAKRGLDSFLAKNTSEDNASFAEIMRVNEERHKQKHSWLHEKEDEQKKRADNLLALPSIETQAIEDGNQTRVETWTYSSKNDLMYVPDGVDLSSREKISEARLKQREIIHPNTRFPKTPFDLSKSKEKIAQAASVQAQNLHGRIGHDGKEIIPSESPKVNGFGFVATPSPAPGVEESPLMTWGEIEGTPFRLDGSDTPVTRTPGPGFKMPGQPKREALLYELADEVGKAHRAKKKEALERVKRLASPSPRFGSASRTERLAGMSPAAKRLASSKLGIRTHTDRALRASYTPSPLRGTPSDKTPLTNITPTPSQQPSSRRSKNRVRTPASSRKASSSTDASSITDDLLQLPKRPNASDFF